MEQRARGAPRSGGDPKGRAGGRGRAPRGPASPAARADCLDCRSRSRRRAEPRGSPEPGATIAGGGDAGAPGTPPPPGPRLRRNRPLRRLSSEPGPRGYPRWGGSPAARSIPPHPAGGLARALTGTGTPARRARRAAVPRCGRPSRGRSPRPPRPPGAAPPAPASPAPAVLFLKTPTPHKEPGVCSPPSLKGSAVWPAWVCGDGWCEDSEAVPTPPRGASLHPWTPHTHKELRGPEPPRTPTVSPLHVGRCSVWEDNATPRLASEKPEAMPGKGPVPSGPPSVSSWR